MADDHEAQLEEEALLEYAEHLGIDPVKHRKYMYIAKQALEAPLPDGWEQGEDEDGTPYYFRTDGEGESVWEYPRGFNECSYADAIFDAISDRF